MESVLLLEFGFRNFFSFKESASVSFRLDANCPESISMGREFTTVLSVKGANASGKTQVLKGLSFLIHFCVDSFSTKPESRIGLSPFFGSKDPCEFYADFDFKGKRYRYELSATDTEVKSETIYQGIKKKTKVIERINNELVFRTKAFAGLDAIKLRKNASIISTANQYDLKQLKDVLTFFENGLSNVNFAGYLENPIRLSEVAEYLYKRKPILEFVKDFIQDCDVGISDIKISKIKNEEGKEVYFPLFVHEANGLKHSIIDAAESSGTKYLFRNLAQYYCVLKNGGVLVVDEFDTNLHPHILPKLIGLFLDPQINANDAQLIFSTHDSEVLNYLGRYRSYLVSKEDNESYLYRLDEIPGDILRNDRPIRPLYNEGKIGGVPKI